MWRLCRRHLIAGLIAACALTADTAALAAPLFLDDVESGALVTTSGGKWSGVLVDANVLAAASADAARRGGFGFRLADQNEAPGERVEGRVEKGITSSATSYYMRFWFRMNTSDSAGFMFLSLLCSPSCTEGYGNILLRSDRTIGIEARSADTSIGFSGWVSQDSSVQLSVGTWYLLELATLQLKSSSQGAVHLWINGQLAASLSGLDFTDKSVGLVVLGEPWTNTGTYRGNLDFDDVYVDDAPLPSHFAVDGPSSMESNACVPLTFSLRDSVSNALAPAPYDVSGIPVTLSGTATAALYSDSSCTTPAPSVGFAPDASQSTLYLKPSATGALTVTAGNGSTDFLRGQRTFTIVAAPPPTLPNGDSCSQGSQCASGFCVDGVCCDSACDAGPCDACSVAQGAQQNGTCRLLPSSTVCRGPADACDAEERCTGSSGLCPADAVLPAGTVCRGARGSCDVDERCTGSSMLCSSDVLVSSAVVCSEATPTHQAASCTGIGPFCPAAAAWPEGEQPEAPSAPEGEPDGSAAAPVCDDASCVSPAELGCSCRSPGGGTGVGALLGSGLLLLLRRRAARGAPRGSSSSVGARRDPPPPG